MLPLVAKSKVQPFDVAFNSEFKRSVDRQATEHIVSHPALFVSGKLTAGGRRIFFTKWVRQAWQETSCRRPKITMVRSFVKCGIALPTSGNRNTENNIDGLADYSIGGGLPMSRKLPCRNLGSKWHNLCIK